ncbi:MAG: PfkB family carbohydrate kinase [Opitutales bacterium]|nr:PfkB family carbohydrate kinase [Opitutales bacterium]
MKELLNQIKRLRVLVVGDVMLDRYVSGEVHRISPEAPVPVLTVGSEKVVAGGAANVALNASSLGADVEVCGWFGTDIQGTQLKELLFAKNIRVDESFCFPTFPTISKTRVTSGNQQICRVDREDPPSNYQPNLSLLGDAFIEKASQSDVVIISDYGKGFISNELLSLLRLHSSFLAVDPKPSRLLDYCKPDLLTPNRLEALELAGKSRMMKDKFPKEQITKEIFDRFCPQKLAITLGSEGMLLAEGGKVQNTIPTAAREVFDVSGAGDTVIAVLAMALVAGGDFKESAKLANLAAGIVVAKVGTATVTTEEMMSVL